MGVEIERKFLVDAMVWDKVEKDVHRYMVQSYLSTKKEAVVRLRIDGEKAFITIKGNSIGISRKEFEYLIPKEDALQIIKMNGESAIEKERYEVRVGNHLWEVDVFLGENQGLIVAEIELSSEEEEFEVPGWVSEEVSDDPKYFNVNLLHHPFSRWSR